MPLFAATYGAAMVQCRSGPVSYDTKTGRGDLVKTKPPTPEQFAAFIRSELAQNARLVKATGAKAD